MSQAVLISIKPKWCDKIASGEKTIEVRKTRPKELPFKCYIYETKKDGGRGKVIGEFFCFEIRDIFALPPASMLKKSCLSEYEALMYFRGKKGFCWYIHNLKIYDEPKELGEFDRIDYAHLPISRWSIERPPQSWCYVEELIE